MKIKYLVLYILFINISQLKSNIVQDYTASARNNTVTQIYQDKANSDHIYALTNDDIFEYSFDSDTRTLTEISVYDITGKNPNVEVFKRPGFVVLKDETTMITIYHSITNNQPSFFVFDKKNGYLFNYFEFEYSTIDDSMNSKGETTPAYVDEDFLHTSIETQTVYTVNLSVETITPHLQTKLSTKNVCTGYLSTHSLIACFYCISVDQNENKLII